MKDLKYIILEKLKISSKTYIRTGEYSVSQFVDLLKDEVSDDCSEELLYLFEKDIETYIHSKHFVIQNLTNNKDELDFYENQIVPHFKDLPYFEKYYVAKHGKRGYFFEYINVTKDDEGYLTGQNSVKVLIDPRIRFGIIDNDFENIQIFKPNLI